MEKICYGYLMAVNLLGLAAMGIDKYKAKKHRWRIPEKVLFAVALMGGSAGAWSGMYLFRHKTRHRKFVIGIPAIVVMQVVLIFMFQRTITG